MKNLCSTCEYADKTDTKVIDHRKCFRCTNESVLRTTVRPEYQYYSAIICEEYLESWDDCLKDLLILTQVDFIESQKKYIKELEDQCDSYELSQIQKESV